MLLNKSMKNGFYLIVFFLIISCSGSSAIDDAIALDEEEIVILEHGNFKILSLGDSYTIGQSVCEKCRFPEQLVDSLLNRTANKSTFPLKIIAQTGWTTSNLINAINAENINADYNFVTLLIGVNNQYQNKPFGLFVTEFPQLVDIAIASVNGESKKLVVLSIPDYSYTPFGDRPGNVSEEIKRYNDFTKSYCEQRNITFLNITDITQQGLINPELVASDGLHPSTEAYTKFIERLLPLAIEKLMLP